MFCDNLPNIYKGDKTCEVGESRINIVTCKPSMFCDNLVGRCNYISDELKTMLKKRDKTCKEVHT